MLQSGYSVRAFVRNVDNAKSTELTRSGAKLSTGDFRQPESIRQALKGTDAVFCVLPSSAQPQYGVSDADEVNFGRFIIDEARRNNVGHFIYSSTSGARSGTGLPHLDTKGVIEEHLRNSGLRYTILRPAGYMENLLWPAFGLASGTLNYFGAPNAPIQLIAVDAIGKFVPAVLADRATHRSGEFDIAGDEAVKYERIPASNPFFAAISKYVDEYGDGIANLKDNHSLVPELQSLSQWIERVGKYALLQT